MAIWQFMAQSRNTEIPNRRKKGEEVGKQTSRWWKGDSRQQIVNQRADSRQLIVENIQLGKKGVPGIEKYRVYKIGVSESCRDAVTLVTPCNTCVTPAVTPV
jgi:hypothetical protein